MYKLLALCVYNNILCRLYINSLKTENVELFIYTLFVSPFASADNMENAGSFGQAKLRNVGEYAVKNFSFSAMPSAVGRWVGAYRARYVTCKNARMIPFFHCVGVCMLISYAIDYKYHLKHEKMRKYH